MFLRFFPQGFSRNFSFCIDLKEDSFKGSVLKQCLLRDTPSVNDDLIHKE
jgi:hypothetical protein